MENGTASNWTMPSVDLLSIRLLRGFLVMTASFLNVPRDMVCPIAEQIPP